MCSLTDGEIMDAASRWNPRNATVAQIRSAFLKVHEVLQANPNLYPSQHLKYANAIFGKNAEKTQQIWWIQNCATCGAPDDIQNGREIHIFLPTTTRADILRWLQQA